MTSLSNERRALRFPSWSPDGHFIAYESQTESTDRLGFIYRIYVMLSDGEDPRKVDYGRGVRSPHWAPQQAIRQGRRRLGPCSVRPD
ncbi:TPA: hypothetical protein DCE37_19930 [Candidatus Latescibacteria bacterium]|nr:hypothetical protein [Candidatus Latescibacterota bacterium]